MRSGIDQGAYERGVSLGKARGHKVPEFEGRKIGERQYENLRRLARGLEWEEGQTGVEVLDRMLSDPDHSVAWIRNRLKVRKADTDAYKQGDTRPGHAHWQRRQTYVPRPWYWYH